jgi:aromatic ring hydroxylase
MDSINSFKKFQIRFKNRDKTGLKWATDDHDREKPRFFYSIHIKYYSLPTKRTFILCWVILAGHGAGRCPDVLGLNKSEPRRL